MRRRLVADSSPTRPSPISQPSLDNPRFPASQNEHSSRHLLSVPRDASPQSTQRCRVSARRSSPDRRSAINAFKQLLPLLNSMCRRPPGLGVSSPYWWLVSSFSSKSQSIHRSFLLVSKLVSCHCHPDAAIFHWVRLYFVSKKKAE